MKNSVILVYHLRDLFSIRELCLWHREGLTLFAGKCATGTEKCNWGCREGLTLFADNCAKGTEKCNWGCREELTLFADNCAIGTKPLPAT